MKSTLRFAGVLLLAAIAIVASTVAAFEVVLALVRGGTP